MRPQISFLMRMYNEERFVESKLSDLIPKLKKSESRSEIVIGIQGNDNSYNIARRFKKSFKSIRIYRMGKPDFNETTNFLVRKARSDIMVIDDADNLFVGNIDRIVRLFKDPRLGGIIQFDVAIREWLNKGHEIFDRTYDEVKLRHHTRNNIATDPIFSVHIFRKSALRYPYITTFSDDTEITHRLIKNKYKVVYDKELAYHIMNNPLQKRVTIMAIFKRRLRTEKFREQAKRMLDTDRFSISNRMSEFAEAVLLTFTRVNVMEFFQFMEYLIVILMATILGELRLLINDEDKYIQIR